MLRVNGGPAGSGTRVVKEPAQDWTHDCPLIWDVATRGEFTRQRFSGEITLAAAYVRCPGCGARRP